MVHFLQFGTYKPFLRHLSNLSVRAGTSRYFWVLASNLTGTFSTQSLFPKLILTLIWYFSYNLVFYYNLVYFLQFGTYKPWLRHLSNCKQISSTSEGRYFQVLLGTCRYCFGIFLQFGIYKPWLKHLSNCKQISSTSEGRYLVTGTFGKLTWTENEYL